MGILKSFQGNPVAVGAPVLLPVNGIGDWPVAPEADLPNV